ncbi:septal ring lytic transglycosylase RlpA family protein [uncultured Thiohalocapsa sp.]|uniref:septal ring lytic transglycosylase RlpA family protein n=1 Tax=uncultured Thiohalocapsa sp. TaxID=768990 RepID=UPI0025F0BE16|nr:septal ring lytic transglycosylase RlpA family protein [uncultured Thiohalocapsa sp.]
MQAPALLCALAVALLLAGCGGGAKQGVVRLDDVPGPEPRVEPKARYGNMQSYVVFGRTYYPKSTSRGHVERGIASWYGPKFHGRKTSSGERYDMHQLTAAHKTLPLPTYALVTNLENGRNLIVRINDRGPFVGDRVIDLSYAAAKQLGMDKKGLAKVQVTSIDPRDHDGKVPKTLRVASAELERYRARRGAETADAGAARAGRAASAPTPAARTGQRRTAAADPAPPGFSRAAAPTRTPEARPAVTGGGWYLQVGAFGTRANAEQMRRRLGGQVAAPVSIADTAADPDGDAALFRVRVGPVGGRADAERLASELAALGIGPALVLPR